MICTLQEFTRFVDPKVRNNIAIMTKQYKSRLGSKCQKCSQSDELDAAHKHGKSRKDIINLSQMDILSNKISIATISCVSVFVFSYVVFGLHNDHLLFTSWYHGILVLGFSFLITEYIILNHYFLHRISSFKKFFEKKDVSTYSFERVKTAIDLESKTWSQQLQVHIFIFGLAMVGFFFTQYTEYAKQLPEELLVSQEYASLFYPMFFWGMVMGGAMFAVLNMIGKYLLRISDILLGSAGS